MKHAESPPENQSNNEAPQVEPGRINALEIIDFMPQGAYLQGDDIDPRILLPRREIPENAKVGDVLSVFLYFDSEDRIIATTQRPQAMLGEFACLKVVDTVSFGAFVDWGLMKDLLIPKALQGVNMHVGESYLVKVIKDRESDLLVGCNKEAYLFEGSGPARYTPRTAVSLLPYRVSELGTVCLIDSHATGLLFKDEYPNDLELGQRMEGWIKAVRPDGKIDLQIRAPKLAIKSSLVDVILEALAEGNGFLPFHDRSTPEEIQARFQVSKKKFRKAISSLYKDRKITLEPDGIRSVNQSD